jgi:hypothetical protein
LRKSRFYGGRLFKLSKARQDSRTAIKLDERRPAPEASPSNAPRSKVKIFG